MILSMINRIASRWVLTALVVTIVLWVWPMPMILSQSDDITIDNKHAERKKTRTGVEFPHSIHMDTYDCLDCHHDYQDGENVLDEDELDEDGSAACSVCHNKAASMDLKTAYHRQCMTCHRTLNREPDYDLPITCKDCHPKNRSAK